MSVGVVGSFAPLQIVTDDSAECLLNILKLIDGKKDLVLDKDVIRFLDNIATFSQLKQCSVERVFKLEPGSAPGQTQNCVYLIRPNIENARIISDHINANLSINEERKYNIIYFARQLHTSSMVLEREGVYGEVDQYQLPLGFVVLDKDLLSLEIYDFYKSFYVKGDLADIHTAAQALMEMTEICGYIPNIYAQGKCAKMVIELMNKLMEEEDFSESCSDRISHLIVLDRDIDYASVLLSQLTYEGLLDETFTINSGRIVFPKEVTGKEAMKVILNSNDKTFDEIRHSYFASVFAILREKAKELQSKSQGTSSMSIGAMKDFVTNDMRKVLQQYSSLSLHIGACEVIMEKKNKENFQERLKFERDIIEGQNMKECFTYIEDVINRLDPYCSGLRLMCLLSLVQDGLPASDYESLVTQFRQSYGSKHLITIHYLKKAGLLVGLPPLLQASGSKSKIEKAATVKASKIAEKVVTAVSFPRSSNFKMLCKKFNLIPSGDENPDFKNPKDLSYVFGGAYVPLVAKITEQIIQTENLKLIEECMKLLPGPTVINTRPVKVDTGYVKPGKDFKSKVVLVFVLGGITYSEIAALRMLEKINGCRILVATTSLINGNSLMQMLSPNS